MDTSNLMIFPELSQEEFDFDSLLDNKDYAVLAGLPVKIDRVVRDITQTTVIAVSGTMIMRGVKVRGVWDMCGNIVEFKRVFRLFTPKGCWKIHRALPPYAKAKLTPEIILILPP